MTRMSKQGERRAVSPRRCRLPSKKTGPLKENLPGGYKPHVNAMGQGIQAGFIPKIKSLTQ